MMDLRKDLDKLQEGSGSQFNSSLATLMRMHQEMLEANYHSGFFTIQGAINWHAALRSLERELFPYMNEEEALLVDKSRVVNIRKDNRMVAYYFERLDKYERVLRSIHASKGFGITAKERMDPGMALEMNMN